MTEPTRTEPLDLAWEALRDGLMEAIDADSALMLMDAIALHRPLIEAAILAARGQQ